MNKKPVFFFFFLLIPSFLRGAENPENQASYSALLTATARPLLAAVTGFTGFNTLCNTVWLQIYGNNLENLEPLTPAEKKAIKHLLINAGGLIATAACLSFFPVEPHTPTEDEIFLRNGLLGVSVTALYHGGGTAYRYFFARRIRRQTSEKRLRTIKTYDQPCAICREDKITSDACHVLSCGHMFHDDCVIPWLALHSNCPQCRVKQEY
jgi:hypothetical protein